MGVIELPYTRSVAAETDPIFERVGARHSARRVAAARALRRGNQPPQARAQRRHPGPQLSGSRDLLHGRRHRRRLAGVGDAGGEDRCRRHRALRRALHGRDGQARQSVQDGPRSRSESRLFACRIDHRCRRSPACAKNIPDTPVVTYVNTSAEVKAESDVCVTSGNAVQIVEALGVPRVIFLPDEYLAKYVASKTDVEIVAWKGHCEVHERFTGKDVRRFREGDPSLVVLAHPECPPDVLAEADYVGSTQGMTEYVGTLVAASREAGKRACC